MKEKPKTTFIDAFVLVVPKANVDAYKEMARMGAETWMKHGALAYKECIGADLSPAAPPGTEQLYFPKMTDAGPDETVWFSYIEFKSREHRDEVNAKVMKEMDTQMEKYKDKPMPFDMKRMAYGGFEVAVSD